MRILKNANVSTKQKLLYLQDHYIHVISQCKLSPHLYTFYDALATCQKPPRSPPCAWCGWPVPKHIWLYPHLQWPPQIASYWSWWKSKSWQRQDQANKEHEVAFWPLFCSNNSFFVSIHFQYFVIVIFTCRDRLRT